MAESEANPLFRKNHYLFRALKPGAANGDVHTLPGEHPVPGHVCCLRRIGCATEKWHDDRHTPIDNARLHYSWYDLCSQRYDAPAHGLARNQFTDQELRREDCVGLLAPARISAPAGPNSVVPSNHYEVYRVVDPEPTYAEIQLRDACGNGEPVPVRVGRAAFLAVPVVKRHNDTAWPVDHPALHYVLYEVQTPDVHRDLEIVDQFQPAPLRIQARHGTLLAVPSEWRPALSI